MGPYHKWMLDFIRNCQTVPQSGCIILRPSSSGREPQFPYILCGSLSWRTLYVSGWTPVLYQIWALQVCFLSLSLSTETLLFPFLYGIFQRAALNFDEDQFITLRNFTDQAPN